jgi:hypothetical protein
MRKEIDYSLIEIMLRLSAIESLLVKSGVLKNDDIVSEMKKISDDVQEKIKLAAEQNKK